MCLCARAFVCLWILFDVVDASAACSTESLQLLLVMMLPQSLPLQLVEHTSHHHQSVVLNITEIPKRQRQHIVIVIIIVILILSYRHHHQCKPSSCPRLLSLSLSVSHHCHQLIITKMRVIVLHRVYLFVCFPLFVLLVLPCLSVSLCHGVLKKFTWICKIFVVDFTLCLYVCVWECFGISLVVWCVFCTFSFSE